MRVPAPDSEMSIPTPGSEKRVPAPQLSRLCAEILEAAGLSPDHAGLVADSLVQANLRGVDSHGVMRLPIYVRRIRQGLINARPSLHLERTGPATAVLDGDHGPGQVVGRAAMEAAVELAREAGAGWVAARRSSHFGATATYAMQAAEAGMVGLALTHAEADVVPHGGREAVLGTNPIAVALPAAGGAPVVLDMATSVVAMGQVLLAREEGRSLPRGWAVDAAGEPTTDPEEARAVLPLGGPKGYGLALVVDALCALLTGSAFGRRVRRMYDDFSAPQELGHLMAAIQISRFVPLEMFEARMAEMIRELKAVPPAPGFEEVLVPGEPERRVSQERRRLGIPLAERTWAELRALAGELGVEGPQP